MRRQQDTSTLYNLVIGKISYTKTNTYNNAVSFVYESQCCVKDQAILVVDSADFMKQTTSDRNGLDKYIYTDSAINVVLD